MRTRLVYAAILLFLPSLVFAQPSGMIMPKLAGSVAANGDITIEGTTSATKTTSYVVLQPTGGKVGIGTLTPLAPLDVFKEGSDQTVIQRWSYGNSPTPIYDLKLKETITSTVVRWTFDQTNNGTAYSNVLTLDRGNVGINTTGPLSKLAINGGVHVGGDSDAGDDNLLVDGTTGFSGYVGHPSFVAQTSNWRVTAAGAADVRTLYADEMHVKAFTADLEQALVGGQIIAKSVVVVAAALTLPAQAASTIFIVEDIANMASTDVFVAGDFVRFRQFTRGVNTLDVADAWGTISATAHTHNGDGTQTWTFVRSATPNEGTASGTITRGQLVIDYGVSGNGLIEATVLDGSGQANAPYTRYLTWTTHPKTGQAIQTQIGNLNGITAASDYGLFAGTYAATNGHYFRASTAAFELHGIDLSLWDGSTKTVSLDHATPSFALGNPLPTAYGTGVGIWMGKDTVYKFRVGDPAAGQLAWDGTTLKAAGWTIGATSLTDTAGVVGMSSAVTGGDDIRFWAGHATPASAPFRVTEAGLLTAVGATMRTAASGGYSVMDATGLSVYTSADALRGHFGLLSNLYGYGAGEANGIAVGNSAATWMSLDGTNGFRVMYGAAVKTQIDASGNASFSGTITAASGSNIANWITTTDVIQSVTGFIGMSSDEDSGYSFWSGHTTPASAPFRVRYDGETTISRATFSVGAGMTLAQTHDENVTLIGGAEGATNLWRDEWESETGLRRWVPSSAFSYRIATGYSGGAPTDQFTFKTGLVVGTATGGDKGSGTINVAGGVYKNGAEIVSFSGTGFGGVSCGTGEAVKSITASDGVVSAATCGTPSPTLADVLAELASLRRDVARLQAVTQSQGGRQ